MSQLQQILVLFAVVVLCQGFKAYAQACTNPKMIEFLFDYTIPSDDLRALVTSNISSLNLDDIKTKNVSFLQTKATFQYTGGKQVKDAGSMKIEVSKDSFSGSIKWVAEVAKKIIGYDTFNVTAQIEPIAVHYTKEYVISKSRYEITNLTYSFTNTMIVNITLTPTPKDFEKTEVEAIVHNELYNQINQKLKSLEAWLNDAVSKQKIGNIFQSDKYEYKYYNWPLTIDTAPIQVKSQGKDVLNGLKGDIVGDTSPICPSGTPDARSNFKFFLSLPFIQSFAKATMERYPNYKDVRINSSNTRTDYFQFRLADLEYILGGVPEKYRQHYMKPVSFSCALFEITSIYPKDNNLNLLAKWSCGGHLWIDSATSFQIIDVEVQSQHILNVRVSNSLSVYNNEIIILGTNFKPVEEITVVNESLAQMIMGEFLNDLRTYTPGTYFAVPQNAQNYEVVSDSDDADGIWIG